jgi:hypothetical protein
MKRSHKATLVLAAALFAIGPASAQQPPDVVVSDANQDTAMGTGALQSLSILIYGGYNDTASGFHALYSNVTGNNNTATGVMTLASNSYGYGNTANGSFALWQNTTGNSNTASGETALQYNTTGTENTASGANALYYNTTGDNNTASGANALYFNISGSQNTADGMYALSSNTTGAYNTAAGSNALFSNTTGQYNIASGAGTLGANTTGNGNTAIGAGALAANSTGGNNIALGYYAGSSITVGYRNIDIGNVGARLDAGTIRIGTSSEHTATYIAGISSAHVTGSAVYISSTGQLGVLASSERYKTAIAPMGETTEKLQQLRPVTFHLKTDPKGAVQYGLIAEEVAKVYPELVIRDDAGKIQGVRYEELAPMLLNEVQKQAAEIRDLKQQQKQSVTQAAKLRDVQQQLAELHAALVKLQRKDELVAQR